MKQFLRDGFHLNEIKVRHSNLAVFPKLDFRLVVKKSYTLLSKSHLDIKKLLKFLDSQQPIAWILKIFSYARWHAVTNSWLVQENVWVSDSDSMAQYGTTVISLSSLCFKLWIRIHRMDPSRDYEPTILRPGSVVDPYHIGLKRIQIPAY